MRENGGYVAVFLFGLVVTSIGVGLELSTIKNPSTEQSDHTSSQPEQRAATPILSVAEPPSGGDGEKRRGCPGTRQPQFDCDAITAEATMRQVDLAAEQSDIGWFNIWVGFATAFVAGMAAWFAKKAAKAARDTVNVLTDVEKADVVVTVENYAHLPHLVHFDLVANNLGRSTALMTNFAMRWSDVDLPDELPGFFPDYKHRIIPASGRVTLKSTVSVKPDALAQNPYLWVLIQMKAPVTGHTGKRFCFQIFEKPMTSQRVTHEEAYSDELDYNDFHRSVSFDATTGRARRWWEFWKPA